MAGLRVAAHRPTNVAKVKMIVQGENESPATFLEHLYDAYRQYTPLDPLAEVNQSAVIMSFINQAAPDIKKKLYKQEGLGEMTIRDLMKVAEKVFNTRETRKNKRIESGKKIRNYKKRLGGRTGNTRVRKTRNSRRKWLKYC
jgi:hypothetical protein